MMMTPTKSHSEPEWRSKSLNERLAYVYTNKLFTDVTIALYLGGKEHVFMAHKNILANFSTVFKKTFYGTERQDQSLCKIYPEDCSRLKLEGIDPQGLSYVLKLLYHIPPSPRKDVDRSILLSAYHAAKELGIKSVETDLLQEILSQVITRSLVTRDDFWKILELSRILKLNEIADKFLRFAESNTKDVLRASSLTKASPTTLRAVLDLDNLKIPERDVLDCVARWNEANLDLPFVNEFVEDLLRCVRFRNLSSLDLCQFVAANSDLISSEDLLGIMMHLGDPTSRPLPTWCSTKFRCANTSSPKDAPTVLQDETATKVLNNSKELSFKITRRGAAGFLNMYFEQKYTDVYFLVGSERKPMKAHRNILAIGSVVFEKMFFSPLPDSRCNIEIPFEDPEGFDKMLMYYYDDSNPESLFRTNDVVVKTFSVALKYGSMNLKNVCSKHYRGESKSAPSKPIKSQVKTFWMELEQAIKQPEKNKNALKRLLDYAAHNTKDVLDRPGFLNATLDAVKCVLQLDTMIIKEIDLLYNIVRWLEQNSKFRKSEKSIYDLLSLVRFSDIKSEDLCSFSAKYGNILPQRQLLSIIIHLNDKTHPLPEWCYKGPPRKLANALLFNDKYSDQQEICFTIPPELKSKLLINKADKPLNVKP